MNGANPFPGTALPGGCPLELAIRQEFKAGLLVIQLLQTNRECFFPLLLWNSTPTDLAVICKETGEDNAWVPALSKKPSYTDRRKQPTAEPFVSDEATQQCGGNGLIVQSGKAKSDWETASCSGSNFAGSPARQV
jgi:hypothetical protein